MRKKDLILLAALGIGGFLLWQAMGKAKSGGGTVDTTAAAVAQAQAAALAAQAESAARIAEAQASQPWYTGAVTGIGQGLGTGLGSLLGAL